MEGEGVGLVVSINIHICLIMLSKCKGSQDYKRWILEKPVTEFETLIINVTKNFAEASQQLGFFQGRVSGENVEYKRISVDNQKCHKRDTFSFNKCVLFYYVSRTLLHINMSCFTTWRFLLFIIKTGKFLCNFNLLILFLYFLCFKGTSPPPPTHTHPPTRLRNGRSFGTV